MDYVIALEDLYVPGGFAKAHSKGDQVPVDNVERGGWQDKVAKPSTKAAKEATAETGTDEIVTEN